MDHASVSDNAHWQTSMLSLLALGVVIAVLYFVLSKLSETTAPESKGDDTAYLESSPLSGVDNVPGYDDSSIRRLPPRFTGGYNDGYRCLRCSDSGSGDADATIASEYPQVTYACAAGEAIAWDRVQNWKRVQESNGVAPGNLVLVGPATWPTKTPTLVALTGLDLCAQLCNEMPEDQFGFCKAAVYDKERKQCQFFYACDEVVPDPNSSLYIRNFTQPAQPDVVTTDY